MNGIDYYSNVDPLQQLIIFFQGFSVGVTFVNFYENIFYNKSSLIFLVKKQSIYLHGEFVFDVGVT